MVLKIHIGKKGGWISRIDIAPGHCKQYYFAPLSKMIEKLEKIKKFTNRKDVLTDLMKEILQVAC